MAYSYHANQKPKFREGSSFFIANDRGYLKPGVPRSKENPWGTFLGTWDMPHRIPQPRPNLTGRNPAQAARLMEEVKASPLYRASNGFGLHSTFQHCVEPAPAETHEEKCDWIQDSSTSPPQQLEETAAGDEGTSPKPGHQAPTPTGAPPSCACPTAHGMQEGHLP
ncbi:protein Flattop isoform X2 [Narcine bancroftii]|uniref:protein Flattop isoform X2 n=1 Tax=Narcine bancroftii TaxID=1343680 RepID=UPI0038316AE0